MKESTKGWTKDFAKRLDVLLSDSDSACGDPGLVYEVESAKRRLVEFVTRRVLVLGAAIDALNEASDAAIEASPEGS